MRSFAASQSVPALGLRGRYIFPVVPLLAWLIPACGPRLERAFAPLRIPVRLFPLLTLAMLPGVIMDRYYGVWPTTVNSLQALLLP